MFSQKIITKQQMFDDKKKTQFFKQFQINNTKRNYFYKLKSITKFSPNQ